MLNNITNGLLNWIRRIQAQQNATAEEYIRRILDYYQNRTLKNINDKIKIVQLKIEANPEITPYQIKRTQEYQDLVFTVSNELDDFVNYSTIQIDLASTQSVRDAIADIGILAGIIDMDRTRIVTPSAIEILTGYLAEDGALYERIGLWAGSSVDAVVKAIIEGVGLGRNPARIGREIYKALGLSLQNAIRTTRTVQLWSYREATRANYIANSDIIKGWIWYAAMDDRTCLSCLNMHGTFHELSERLNDHYNGRCTMLPYPFGMAVIDITGQQFFDGLEEKTRIEMMGKAKHQAYMDGLFTFDQLTRELPDPVYGLMRTETPLRDLINEQ